jgi:hypothetical protein
MTEPSSAFCHIGLHIFDISHISSYRMELVWHGEFERLFAQYFPHFWQLVPTFNPPTDGWRVFKDSAKVRFSCQVCI